MIPFAFENHVRTKNCAPFGIAIETASLTKSELSAGDPVALPLNLTWVKVAAGLSIAAGTYAGGWRIMRTLGQRVFQIDPPAGFAAQAASGAVIYASTKYGYPLSTTHVVSGAVMGAGATKRLSAVRWGVAGNIVIAWILTIPAAGLVSAALWYPVKAIF